MAAVRWKRQHRTKGANRVRPWVETRAHDGYIHVFWCGVQCWLSDNRVFLFSFSFFSSSPAAQPTCVYRVHPGVSRTLQHKHTPRVNIEIGFVKLCRDARIHSFSLIPFPQGVSASLVPRRLALRPRGMRSTFSIIYVTGNLCNQGWPHPWLILGLVIYGILLLYIYRRHYLLFFSVTTYSNTYYSLNN